MMPNKAAAKSSQAQVKKRCWILQGNLVFPIDFHDSHCRTVKDDAILLSITSIAEDQSLQLRMLATAAEHRSIGPYFVVAIIWQFQAQKGALQNVTVDTMRLATNSNQEAACILQVEAKVVEEVVE